MIKYQRMEETEDKIPENENKCRTNICSDRIRTNQPENECRTNIEWKKTEEKYLVSRSRDRKNPKNEH